MRLPLLGGRNAGAVGSGLTAAPSGREESWDLWPGCASSLTEPAFRGLHFPGCIGEEGKLSRERAGRPQSPGAAPRFPSAAIQPSNPPPGFPKAALWPRLLSPGWTRNLSPLRPVTKPTLGCGRRGGEGRQRISLARGGTGSEQRLEAERSGDALRERLDRVWESRTPPGRQCSGAGVSLEAGIPWTHGGRCARVCACARVRVGGSRSPVFPRASPPHAGLEVGPRN